jgi:hypothetical protein
VSVPTPTGKGILGLLDFGHALKTPAFQRSFAWERPQVDDYFNDLTRALDVAGGPADYFLGLIVVDDTSQIQDGQQRLATTLLLASAIYELAEAVKQNGAYDSQLATDVVALVTPALRQAPDAPLTIGLNDQDVLLRRAGIRPDSPESTKRLKAARDRLHEHLAEDLAKRSSQDAKLGRLKQWGEFLRKEAYVVELTVPPQDAHNIFETLNTRGVRLSNGDLVKSHLIGRATGTNVPLAIKKWNDITAALTVSGGKYEDDLESFLLHYYGSMYGRTTKPEFFAAYRKKIESLDPIAALDKLLESAKLYRALTDPSGKSAFWSQIGEGSQQAVELINGLGLKQLRYLLLAVLRDFPKSKSGKERRQRQRMAVLKVTAWSVRGLVHGQTGGGEAEKTYISAAEQIRTGAIETVAKLRNWFISKDMLVTDDVLFKGAFMEFLWDHKTSHNRARAILYALDYHLIPSKSALKPRDSLTIEHVLPQSPSAGQWTSFSDDERLVYTYRLGNLLLIDGPSGANNLLKNKPWSQKKQLIKTWGPQTPLTTKALSLSKWEKATIDRRLGQLGDVAIKAWAC